MYNYIEYFSGRLWEPCTCPCVTVHYDYLYKPRVYTPLCPLLSCSVTASIVGVGGVSFCCLLLLPSVAWGWAAPWLNLQRNPFTFKERPTASAWQTSNINEILPGEVGFKNLLLWAVSGGALDAPTHCPLFPLQLFQQLSAYSCAKSNPLVLLGFMHTVTLCSHMWNAADEHVRSIRGHATPTSQDH